MDSRLNIIDSLTILTLSGYNLFPIWYEERPVTPEELIYDYIVPETELASSVKIDYSHNRERVSGTLETFIIDKLECSAEELQEITNLLSRQSFSPESANSSSMDLDRIKILKKTPKGKYYFRME